MIATDSPRLDAGSLLLTIVVGGNNIGGGGSEKVSVSPASASLQSNQKQQFTATVSGTSNTGVTWSATAGSVDVNGEYTAPTVNSQTSAVVTATSNADNTKSASATIILEPVNIQSLKIVTEVCLKASKEKFIARSSPPRAEPRLTDGPFPQARHPLVSR